jgi:hypothetical protein
VGAGPLTGSGPLNFPGPASRACRSSSRPRLRRPQKQRKSPPRARNAQFAVENNMLDQLVRSQIQGLQNNEIGAGYQPNLHIRQGTKTTGRLRYRKQLVDKSASA